jgi:hypothetical protein
LHGALESCGQTLKGLWLLDDKHWTVKSISIGKVKDMITQGRLYQDIARKLIDQLALGQYQVGTVFLPSATLPVNTR